MCSTPARFPSRSKSVVSANGANGRIEIASALAEADGHPRLPQPIADPRPSLPKLRLLSPASYWLMNHSFGNDSRILAQLGSATVALHPEDAAALGLAEGDEARLTNETGELILQVRLSDEILPGVALAHKGRWLKGEITQANVNVLNPGTKTDMGESSSVHGVEVRVTPVAAGVSVPSSL